MNYHLLGSIYISENFIKRFGFWQFSLFLPKNIKKAKKGQKGQKGRKKGQQKGQQKGQKRTRRPNKAKKRPKKTKTDNQALNFFFGEKHLYTKVQKISFNSLDFENFLHF